MNLIRYHRFAVARSAKDNASVALAARYCFRGWANEDWIIHRLFVKRA
jgi:hypothetical protein